MKLWIGITLMVAAVVSYLAEQLDLMLPTISWGYNLSRTAGELALFQPLKFFIENAGDVTAVVLLLLGLWLVISKLTSGPPNPVTIRKIQRFKAIKRGYYSFLILIGLAGFAALDQIVVGKEALAVKHDGEWFFPAFTTKLEKNKDLGIDDDGKADLEPNYRELKKDGNYTVILPLRPYAPTQDTINALGREISPAEIGYNGLGTRLFDSDRPEKPHLRFTYRKGLRQGDAQGWDANANRVYKAKYEGGELVEGSEEYTGEGTLEEFMGLSGEQEYDVSYPPSEPKWAFPLGTTSQGDDVLAYLFGGLQVNFKAALIFIPIVYFIGITVGLLMGYFGGWFDLVVQRVIEVLANIPFLFLVIIVTLGVPPQYKDRLGLYLILLLLAVFGWMGMTNLMRTAALKEKARDYIAATRVLGAGVPRILFRHLLPNTVAILVTLIPFSISGVILSLTALDYLGFVPSDLASWGKLLKDGLSSLSSPWLVSAAFACLVTLLVLVTFVGEAIREAFDPKKYTFYR
ncbi:ABC transporter permease subunit [bacterium]|nr:ABC transporter permease subunit [bacterium]MDA7907800.1 ABC transporter permease subunit [Akkermansiaceae bacterium]MDA7929791.1 ABC transporter permease subunit [Akkermansiaceae bacterium]MDA8976526.1 ABC transporter permease subunit [bacterium]MDB4465298.1 ABC transporter permease subunit [Akkermansiaceae bacterium]